MSLQLAEQFEANEQYEEAYREYKKEYETNPDNMGILERLGHLSLILDKPEEAAGYYHEILKRDVTNPLAYEQLMTIYEDTDAYKYYVYRGNKNSIEGKLDFAISDFKKALGLCSEGAQSAMTRFTLANLYKQAGQDMKAIEFTNDELLKIQCMLEIGQVEEAYTNLNNLSEELKQSPRYFTLRAQYFYSAKKFDEALECIDEYNKLSPNSPLTYQMRALVYDEKGDEYNSHLNWGRYNIVRGNYDIAINEYLNAVQINDNDIDLLFELAALLESNKEVDHASEYYVKIIKKDPANKEALRKLASYKESIGDYQGQVNCLEKLIDIDGNDLDALKNLGRAYEKTRANGKALELYQHYIEIVKSPADYKIIKDKIEKLQNGGAEENSEGLLDKIMKLFGK